MKRVLPFIALCSAIALGAVLSSSMSFTPWTRVFAVENATTETDPQTSKIAQLLEEKHEALKARLKFVEELASLPSGSPIDVFEAQELLIQCELEQTSSQSDRIALLKSRLENFKNLEQAYEMKKTVSRATDADILLAKSKRTQAEIDLLRNETK